jgi:hypothetical protein
MIPQTCYHNDTVTCYHKDTVDLLSMILQTSSPRYHESTAEIGFKDIFSRFLHMVGKLKMDFTIAIRASTGT